MWLPSEFAAGILLLGMIMYAAFGGADFGGGIWTALASGPRRSEQRQSLFHAIGPVWETNHVWLIFVVVVLFTVFPKAFSALFVALFLPLILALIGVNFRGAAFAFRHFGRQTGRAVPFMAGNFEIWSILTPLALGIAVTAPAAGRIRMIDNESMPASWLWLTPFTMVGGLVGLAICAYLAPIYMTVRTKGELREDFRRRGMAAGLVLGFLTALEIPVAILDTPLFAERLIQPGPLACIALAAACGIGTEILLWRRRFLRSQVIAGGTVTFTLCGFAAAIFPDILLGQLSIADAAAPPSTLNAFFGVLALGVPLLVPALVFLYWTFRGSPDPEAPPQEFRI